MYKYLYFLEFAYSGELRSVTNKRILNSGNFSLSNRISLAKAKTYYLTFDIALTSIYKHALVAYINFSMWFYVFELVK